MTRISFLYIGIVFIVLIASCKHEIIDNNQPTEDPYSVIIDTVCDSSTIYFVNDVLPILSSSCAMQGCHNSYSAPEGVILTDYISVINTGGVVPGNGTGSKLYKVLIGNGEDLMPPPPRQQLSTEQVNIIKNWIDQGAKNNECTDCNSDTLNITFSGTIQPILSNNCTGCHNSSSASGNPAVILDNYTSVKTEVDNGRLLGSITSDTAYASMPPAGPLPDCEISKIKIWINNGAPNN